MRLFYSDIQPKRQQVAKNERMRLQVDLEFQQNEIKIERKIKRRNVQLARAWGKSLCCRTEN